MKTEVVSVIDDIKKIDNELILLMNRIKNLSEEEKKELSSILLNMSDELRSREDIKDIVREQLSNKVIELMNDYEYTLKKQLKDPRLF